MRPLRVATSTSFLLFLIAVNAFFFLCSVVSADPLREVQKSRVYRKVLGGPNKSTSPDKVYTKKWLNPGSFFGQLFLQDDGYLLLFEWLSLPALKYGPVTTTIRRKTEYLEVVRTYLDSDAKAIAISILIPHPRSQQVVDQGIIQAFQKRIPTPELLHSKKDLDLAEGKKATLYKWEDNQCSIVYRGSKSSLIEARVESCRLESNLENFVKDLNLTLFDQRLES